MGVIEEINGKLDRIIAFLQSQAATAPAAATPAPAPAPVAADPFGGLGGAPAPAPAAAAPVTVTAEMLMALIQPHVSNDATKAKLGEAMRAAGVDNLNNAKPEQYGDLYARFQQVINAASAAPAATAASII